MDKRDHQIFSEEDFPDKSLPTGHREAFLEKLEQHFPERKTNPWRIWAIAASLAVLLGSSLLFWYGAKDHMPDTVAQQWEQTEQVYLDDIAKEWNNFVALTEDQHLVDRYRQRLEDLDASYHELSKMYAANNKDTLVVTALISNLQSRLDFLRDIQKHIKLIQSKKENNETVL